MFLNWTFAHVIFPVSMQVIVSSNISVTITDIYIDPSLLAIIDPELENWHKVKGQGHIADFDIDIFVITSSLKGWKIGNNL